MADPEDNEDSLVHQLVEYQPALRAFVISLMPGAQVVDDILQDANTVIWEKRSQYQAGTSFKAWAFSVIRFRVLSHWRDEQRNRECALPDDVLSILADSAPDHILSELMADQLEALRHCITALGADDRALIMQRYWKTHSLAELSKESGRTANSLKVSLFRIRRVLRNCVTRRISGSGPATPLTPDPQS